MTEAQFICALFAAPFLLLSAFWLIGLVLVERLDRAPVKVKKDPRQ